jgi:very-short-patch-repair endonuclease
MRVKRTTLIVDEPMDKRIGELAKRQRGYVTRTQLLRLGLGREAINRRVKSTRLIRVYDGVYAVGHVPALPHDRAYGALLACGPKSVLSHGSAATLYGIYRRWDMPFEVTVPTKRRPRGVRMHRAKLTRRDISRHDGVRVTSPARALLDMAPRLTEKQRRRAFNKLRLSHNLTEEQLRDVLERFPRHPGARRLRALAGIHRGATRSRLEDKFDDFCERWSLGRPRLNEKIDGREVDAFFPKERLIVEVDGYDVHSGRVSFEDDRDRDADMLALDLPTVRVTEERMDNEPEREAERLRRILAIRRRRQSAEPPRAA